MTEAEIRKIVSAITYKPGWAIRLGYDMDRPYIQAEVSTLSDLSLDATKRDGTRTPWKSGKRYLSTHMCRQEIVGSVLGLIEDAEMHEVREWFRYRGAAIYNPHLDPDVLVAVAKKKASFNVRDNAMTMEEQVDHYKRKMAAAPDHGADPAYGSWFEKPTTIEHGPDSQHRAWGCECDACVMR